MMLYIIKVFRPIQQNMTTTKPFQFANHLYFKSAFLRHTFATSALISQFFFVKKLVKQKFPHRFSCITIWFAWILDAKD